jgi:uncharacterized membrane protein
MLFLAVLIAPPLVTLLASREPFSGDVLFVVFFILWPWVLEFPAWTIRQIQADATFQPLYARRSRAYDWFMHAFFALVALVAIGFLLLDSHDLNKTELAALWAVALAGGADMVRSVAAYSLAELKGFPLYGKKSRK